MNALNRSPKSDPNLAAEADLARRLRKVVDGGPDAITERLRQLDAEWTAGRAAAATAGLLVVAGLAVGLTVNLWWLTLAIVGGAMLVPALFGRQSLTTDLFHALGLRCGSEIDHEKVALKVLRGDFRHLPTVHHVETREDISRLEGEGGIVYEPDDSRMSATEAVHVALGAAMR